MKNEKSQIKHRVQFVILYVFYSGDVVLPTNLFLLPVVLGIIYNSIVVYRPSAYKIKQKNVSIEYITCPNSYIYRMELKQCQSQRAKLISLTVFVILTLNRRK